MRAHGVTSVVVLSTRNRAAHSERRRHFQPPATVESPRFRRRGHTPAIGSIFQPPRRLLIHGPQRIRCASFCWGLVPTNMAVASEPRHRPLMKSSNTSATDGGKMQAKMVKQSPPSTFVRTGLLKWTQEELAQRANVTSDHHHNWENERPFPVKRHALWCAMRSSVGIAFANGGNPGVRLIRDPSQPDEPR